MWHFGQDALTNYSGEKFDMSCEDSLNVFYHIYSKEHGGYRKMKVRKEVQEYPSNPLEEAFMDKLKEDDDILGWNLEIMTIFKVSVFFVKK